MNIKKIFFSLIALVSVVLVSGCSDEPIETDYVPIWIEFNIVSPDGTNLITEGGELYGTDFSVTYDGKVYKADWDYYQSRMYMAHLKGLVYDNAGNNSILRFGQFDGAGCDEEIIFEMPNGEKHNIHVVRSWKKDKSKQTVTLDGVKVPEMSDGRCDINFTFVYKAN